jgi:exosortase C (VPDSG-CTERM-specific)
MGNGVAWQYWRTGKGELVMPSHELTDSKRDRYEPAAKRLTARNEQKWAGCWRQIRGLIAVTVVLTVCFGRPLYDLAWYSLHSELHSYIPLIPFISLYLIWSKRRSLTTASEPARRFAALPLLGGLATLAAYFCAISAGWRPSTEDYLALMTLSFLLSFVAGSFVFLGRETLRTIAFPLGVLIFIIPFPGFLQGWIECFLQQSSAQAADMLFWMSATPIFRQGPILELPGFSLQVAPECSGIHSTLVLFITSLLAGHLFLRSAWHRALLTLSVIPLAILRNGLRIFTIGQLCVRVSPDMINSYIHRHGGPIFFALSLIPFFLLLFILRTSERRAWASRPFPTASPGHKGG